MTGRLIIPRYDVIFVAPVATCVIGWYTPEYLKFVGIPDFIAVAIAAAAATAIVLSVGPNLQDWQYTGHHRIVPGLLTKSSRGIVEEI